MGFSATFHQVYVSDFDDVVTVRATTAQHREYLFEELGLNI